MFFRHKAQDGEDQNSTIETCPAITAGENYGIPAHERKHRLQNGFHAHFDGLIFHMFNALRAQPVKVVLKFVVASKRCHGPHPYRI